MDQTLQTYLLYSVLFVGTMMLVEGFYVLIRDRYTGPREAVNRRLRMIATGKDTKRVLSQLRRDNPDSASRFFTKLLPSMNRILTQSGSTMSFSRLIIIVIVSFVVLFAFFRLAFQLPLWGAPIPALLISIVLPLLFLLHRRYKRVRRFGEQLPDVLDLIVRGLRAGYPISSAMGLVAEEMSDPAGTEFGIAVDEMTYGLDIHHALTNMSDRVPHDDLRFVVVSVQIQYSVGGNLAEVLDNLSKVIRDRFQMFAKIRAITAEARLSAIVIGLLPFAVGLFVNTFNPSFYGAVWTDPLFMPLMITAMVLLVTGQIILWRMAHQHV